MEIHEQSQISMLKLSLIRQNNDYTEKEVNVEI